MQKSGGWSGRIFDSNGRTGTIEISIPTEVEKGIGSLKIKIAERDGSPIFHQAEIMVTVEGARTHLRSQQKLQKGSLVEWDGDFDLEEAGRYAKAAMFGVYTTKGGGFDIPLTRGVAILWRF